MNTKSFILSSAGLKNVIESYNEFTFCIGKCEIRMNNVFAEFISPIVSQLHHSDPTVNSIHFNYTPNANLIPLEEIFTEEMVSLLQQISKGSQIRISPEQSSKLQKISIFLGNSELFNSLQDLYPQETEDNNFDEHLTKLILFQYQSEINSLNRNIDLSSLINHVSSNFYQIDKNKLKQLPKTILYDIISNKHLKIENEDTLYDFIKEIFTENENENECELTIYDFYEKVEFVGLSDEKFKEFVSEFNPNSMTCSIWRQLCNRFLSLNISQKRYTQKLKEKLFLYSGNETDSFHGIINFLTKEFGGNVSDKGEVTISASPSYDSNAAKNVADLEDKKSGNITNSSNKEDWLLYDFKNRKVRPTHYSIRSYDWRQNSHHLKDWVIEASNTGSNDWKVLDTRNGETHLNGPSAFYTFKINENLNEDEYYRFLRVRLTGNNYAGNHQMCVNALEYFGSIKSC